MSYHDTAKRLPARLAALKEREQEQDARNAEHLLEQARAFAAMPESWKRLYERRVTDRIGGRQAVEEDH